MANQRGYANWGDSRLPDRFWSKVSPCPMSGCWLWTGPILKGECGGYGFFKVQTKNEKAHRVSFESLVGEIPTGLQLDHLCRVRCCVNPAHLEPVTQTENMRRGSMVAWWNRLRDSPHCGNGHLWSENIYWDRRGYRGCKSCRREAQQKRRAKAKQSRLQGAP